MGRGEVYEDKDRGICETFRGICLNNPGLGEERNDKSNEVSIRSSVLHGEESSRGGESGNSNTRRYGYVYITENLINHKKYIGQHKSDVFDESYKGSGKILKLALSKYGTDNFKSEVLEWAEDRDELNALEIKWIEFYHADQDENFYNISHGGNVPDMRGKNNPNYGKVWSKEKRRNQSEAVKTWWESTSDEYKKTFSENAKKRFKNPTKGKRRVFSDEWVENIKRETKIARSCEESRRKSRDAMTKAWKDERKRENIIKSRYKNLKPVFCIETQRAYRCAENAIDIENIQGRTLRKCLKESENNKFFYTCNGSHWMYITLNEYNNIINNEGFQISVDIKEGLRVGEILNIIARRKPILCIEVGKMFSCYDEAIEYLGVSDTRYIRHVVNMYDKGVYETAYGYHWKHVDKEKYIDYMVRSKNYIWGSKLPDSCILTEEFLLSQLV